MIAPVVTWSKFCALLDSILCALELSALDCPILRNNIARAIRSGHRRFLSSGFDAILQGPVQSLRTKNGAFEGNRILSGREWPEIESCCLVLCDEGRVNV